MTYELFEAAFVATLATGFLIAGAYFIIEAINGFIFEASRAIRRWRRGQR